MSDKTPGQMAYDAACGVTANVVKFESLLPEQRKLWEDMASAVIAHVRPQIEAEARAAAVEECAVISWSAMMDYCKKNGMHPGDNGDLFSHISEIRAIASAPPGYVCVPLRPERERIKSGAERLLRWQDDTNADDFSGLQWASAMQDAERVYLSMVNYDAAARQK